MTALDSAVPPPRPLLLQGAEGALCAWYYPPAPGSAPRGDVLVLPAFAEEMNRCRAMVALQARAWATQGVGTLVLDGFGTGDSAGEFVDATWAGWRADMHVGLRWLARHGQGCCGLLGIRLGAIMAAQICAELSAARAGTGAGLPRLVLWQPVTSAKTFYTQFLRIRIAAELNLPDRVKTTNELRQHSAAGEVIEVSGYAIGPRLAQELDALTLEASSLAQVPHIDWFEVAADVPATLAPASQKFVDAWSAAGLPVTARALTGPAFWQVHERELAPALVESCGQQAAGWPVLGKAPTTVSVADSAEVAETAETADFAATSPETPLLLACGPQRLSAMLHRAQGSCTRGVVIVVAGGPQYRAGAHRQFVSLARKLAASGCAVLRFDLCGMGDSSGQYLGFEHSGADIQAAIDGLCAQVPGLQDLVLLGECESASGILFYAWRDPRVTGTVLINPWVRTEEGRAQVIVNHYYLDRLRSPEFWKLVRQGKFDLIGSLKSMVEVGRAYMRGKRMFARSHAQHDGDDISALPLPVKTAVGLRRFGGQVLLLMSGHDYIAREFDEVTAASRAWDGLLSAPTVKRVEVDGADHTFSKAVWKNAASDAVVQWLKRW